MTRKIKQDPLLVQNITDGAGNTVSVSALAGLSAPGATSINELVDTPASFGAAGEALVVNGTTDGVEYAAVGGAESTIAATNSGADSVADAGGPIRMITWTLTSVAINLAAATDIGDLLLGTVGARHWMCNACTCDLSFDKNSVIADGTTLSFGVGTTANASFPVSTAAENLMVQQDLTTSAPVVTSEKTAPTSTGANAAAAMFPRYFSRDEVGIHLAIGGNNTGSDGDILVTGTVTLHITDLGILGDD
jgi:hypothetical protein